MKFVRLFPGDDGTAQFEDFKVTNMLGYSLESLFTYLSDLTLHHYHRDLGTFLQM